MVVAAAAAAHSMAPWVGTVVMARLAAVRVVQAMWAALVGREGVQEGQAGSLEVAVRVA